MRSVRAVLQNPEQNGLQRRYNVQPSAFCTPAITAKMSRQVEKVLLADTPWTRYNWVSSSLQSISTSPSGTGDDDSRRRTGFARGARGVRRRVSRGKSVPNGSCISFFRDATCARGNVRAARDGSVVATNGLHAGEITEEHVEPDHVDAQNGTSSSSVSALEAGCSPSASGGPRDRPDAFQVASDGEEARVERGQVVVVTGDLPERVARPPKGLELGQPSDARPRCVP